MGRVDGWMMVDGWMVECEWMEDGWMDGWVGGGQMMVDG